jgi:hypothetical protein
MLGIILCGSDHANTEATRAFAEIKNGITEGPSATLNVRQCDLASLDSVASFPEGLRRPPRAL